VSGGPARPRHLGRYLVEALLLAALVGMLWAATRFAPDVSGGTWTIASIGFLLLAGTLLSQLLEPLGMPHLTGYLLAGIVGGPHVLRLVDQDSVTRLSPVNTLALSLIALEGGAELKLDFLTKGLRTLACATVVQTFLVIAAMTAVFFSLRPLLPFTQGMGVSAMLGVSLLWGAMAITRSPSATLGILSQTRAAGPLARFTLTFVMTSDLLVVIVLATAMTVARPLVDPGATLSTSAFEALGREILGSVSLGTTLGLVLAAYMRLVGKQLVLVFVALGFGATEVLKYLSLDPLLTFMVAGFLVQNLSKQGPKFLHAIAQMGGIVYVVFFATAGADLDLALLQKLWPIALLLAASRGFFTYVSGRIASRWAKDDPIVRKWGFSGLVSQAGLALGLAALVAREFPAFGEGFRALAIATIALNEMLGPILFKLALDRSGEVSHERGPSLPSTPSMAPSPPIAE
jgi:Kef-type K+ transport system membrane component KefB